MKLPKKPSSLLGWTIGDPPLLTLNDVDLSKIRKAQANDPFLPSEDLRKMIERLDKR